MAFHHFPPQVVNTFIQVGKAQRLREHRTDTDHASASVHRSSTDASALDGSGLLDIYSREEAGILHICSIYFILHGFHVRSAGVVDFMVDEIFSGMRSIDAQMAQMEVKTTVPGLSCGLDVQWPGILFLINQAIINNIPDNHN